MEQKVNYNYQVIYKINDNDRIVFVGVTDLTLDELLNSCDESLDLSIDAKIESVSFSPVNLNENGQKE